MTLLEERVNKTYYELSVDYRDRENPYRVATYAIFGSSFLLDDLQAFPVCKFAYKLFNSLVRQNDRNQKLMESLGGKK